MQGNQFSEAVPVFIFDLFFLVILYVFFKPQLTFTTIPCSNIHNNRYYGDVNFANAASGTSLQTL